LKKKTKTNHILILVIFSSAFICLLLLFNIVNLLKYRSGKPSEIMYTNKVDSDIKYNVYLKPNDFIEDNHISDQYSFITSLIEYIKTTFRYDYSGTEDTKLSYDYAINATIVSQYMSDNKGNALKPLWNKNFVLLKHKKAETATGAFEITEDLNLGLTYYNDLLETFRKTLNIPLDSRLDIVLSISIDFKSKDNKPIHKEHYMTMSIPLGVSVFNITTSKSFPDQEITYSKEPKALTTSYMLVIIYIIIIIAVIYAAFYYITVVNNPHKNEFKTKINKILKDYDDRIVTVNNFIRYENMDVMNVSSFEELLTLSDETLEPIIYFEKKNQISREVWFAIIRDKILYCYVASYRKK